MRTASSRRDERLGAVEIAQQLARAIAAASAPRADAKLEGELIQRASPFARALADGFFGDGIANADVQDQSPQ